MPLKERSEELTVGTPVRLQAESDPPVRVPVQREEPDVPSDDRVLELVLNHAVCVTVPWKGLRHKHTRAAGYQEDTPVHRETRETTTQRGQHKHALWILTVLELGPEPENMFLSLFIGAELKSPRRRGEVIRLIFLLMKEYGGDRFRFPVSGFSIR